MGIILPLEEFDGGFAEKCEERAEIKLQRYFGT
jgi:hypothetical protein